MIPRTFLFVMHLLLTLSSVVASDLHINATLNNMILGSCHNDRKVKPNQPIIWESIQQEDPDIFVWTGDAVYPAQRDLANLTYMKQLYDNMLSNDTIGYNQLQTKYGIYGTWDDHDLGALNEDHFNVAVWVVQDLTFIFFPQEPTMQDEKLPTSKNEQHSTTTFCDFHPYLKVCKNEKASIIVLHLATPPNDK